METRCPLCNEPMPEGGFVTATVTMANGSAPDPMCARCVVLPAEDRKPLRDRAMMRMLRNGTD